MQFHLNDSQHARAYAETARPTDPASRLGVSIRGYDHHGLFHVWLSTRGALNAMKMNSLDDVLEDYSLEESQSFTRQWHHKRSVPCDRFSRTQVYT